MHEYVPKYVRKKTEKYVRKFGPKYVHKFGPKFGQIFACVSAKHVHGRSRVLLVGLAKKLKMIRCFWSGMLAIDERSGTQGNMC